MSFPIANHLWQSVADWSDAWGRWMLVGLFQGIVSALLVGAILWFGRRRLTAPLRYCLLFLLLVKLAAPPLSGFPIGVFTWFHADWAQRSVTSVAERPVSSDVEPTRESLAPFVKSEEPAVNSENQPMPKPSVVRSSAIPEPLPDDAARIPADALPLGDTAGNIAATTSPPLSDAIRSASEAEGVPAEPRASSSSFSLTPEEPAAISGFVGESLPWRQWIMLAHIGGFLAFVVAIGLGHWRMVRRAHRSSLVQLSDRWVEVMAGATAKLGCRPARLVISPRIETPCVAGWWRPTIYLPAWAGDLDGAQRTALVAHELAHVCRWDHWLAPVQSLLVAWLWWNPLAWYVGRLIRRERECCCDDFVLARDCCEPRLYAELLVNTMARTSFVRWTAAWGLHMAESIEPVAERLERIMEPVNRPVRVRRWELAASVVLAAVLLPSVPRAASTSPPEAPAASLSNALTGRASAGEDGEDPAPSLAIRVSVEPQDQKPASAPTLRVIVRDDSGAPVAGAQAVLLHAGKTLTFDGDEQGRVKVVLSVAPSELQFPFFDITWPGFTRSHTVSIKPGEALPESLEVKLPPTRTVRGRLVDHEDRPVTKARICSGFSAANVPVPVRDWPGGEFVVQAAATDPKFGASSQSPILLAIEAPDLAVAVVQVTQSDEPLTIRLGPGKPVGGRVVDPQGRPVAGVRLISDFVGPTNPPTVKVEAFTDDSGVFWFEHFPTDVAMKFSVMHPDHTNLRRQEFTPGKVDHQLTLASPLVVAGRVVDEVTDEQLGRVMVQQGTTGSGHTTWRFQRPVAYDDGRFEMKFNEVPANAVLRILADGFQPLVLQPPINQYGKPDQVFGLKRSHPISLRVLTNEGQPAKDFVVEVHSAAEEDLTRLQTAVRDRRMKLIDVAGPIAAALDTSGRARITKAPDGKRLLTVYDATATPVYEEEIEVGPALATKEYVVRIVPHAKPVAVAKTVPATPAKSTAAPAAARVGNILLRATRDGTPLAGAQVGLIPRPGYRSERNGRTGNDGTFLFGGLNPGLYDVQLFDGFIFVGSQQLTRMQRSVRVRVDPDKTVEVLALGGPGTSLDGKLVDSQGKPVPGTFTLLTYLGSQLPLGERGAATACPFARAAVEPPGADAGPTLATMTLHTDSDGRFSAPELAPGFYQAMFRRNPAGTTDQDFEWHTHFEIKPDQPRVALQFQPQPGPRLRPGEPAPELVGAEAGGEKSLARLRGRVVVLDFWGSWNKPSIAGLATMRQLHEKFAGRDLVVLGVNLDETLDAMNQAVSQHGVGWPQVHVAPEKAGHVLDQFGVRALPERFVIGKDGRVVRAGVDDDELVAAVEEAMKP